MQQKLENGGTGYLWKLFCHVHLMMLFFYLNRTLVFPFPKFSYYAIVQKEL